MGSIEGNGGVPARQVKEIDYGAAVFTTGQVARVCQVASRTVSKWVDNGLLRGYRIPGSTDRRIPRESLIRFLRDNGMPMSRLLEDYRCPVAVVGPHALTSSLRRLLPAHQIEYVASLLALGRLLGRSCPPECIVVDVSLGRGECLLAVADIKRDATLTHTPIVGLCGEDESDLGQWFERGCAAVLKHPVDAPALAAKVLEITARNQESNHEPG